MNKILSKGVLAFLLTILSIEAFALQIGQVASKKSQVGTIFVDDKANAGINNTLSGTTKIVVAVSALIGFLFAAKGLHMIYQASQPQPQSTYAKGIIVLLVGGALVSLPWVVFTSSNTVQSIKS